MNKLKPPQKAGVAGGLAAAIALAAPVVMQWEGKRNDPYNDIVGVRTVCYGETSGVQERRYSDAECIALLDKSLMKHGAPVLDCVPQLHDKPYQLAASVSIAYNIGVSAFCKSTMAKQFRLGNDAAACKAFDLWVVAGGKRVQGLVNRRADERKLCERGL